MFILILPLVFSLYLYYDKLRKKLFFAIYIFGLVKVLSGYVSNRIKGGVYIHLSQKKAIIIKLSALKNIGNGPNYLTVINLSSIYFLIDVGIKSASILTVIYSIVKNVQSLSKLLNINGSLIKIKTDLNVYPIDLSLISVKIKLKITFNLISILVLLIANYISKGIKNVKRKKFKFKRQHYKIAQGV